MAYVAPAPIGQPRDARARRWIPGVASSTETPPPMTPIALPFHGDTRVASCLALCHHDSATREASSMLHSVSHVGDLAQSVCPACCQVPARVCCFREDHRMLAVYSGQAP
jgi:hypothetical protein